MADLVETNLRISSGAPSGCRDRLVLNIETVDLAFRPDKIGKKERIVAVAGRGIDDVVPFPYDGPYKMVGNVCDSGKRHQRYSKSVDR